ncbi:hypothetical protein D3C87_1575900 [compost metagenome]
MIVLAPVDGGLDLKLHHGEIVRMDVRLEVVERAAEAARFQAVKRFQARRPDHLAGVEIPFPCPHPACFERHLQPPLAVAHRLLRLLALGDIDKGGDSTLRYAERIDQRRGIAQEMPGRAVVEADLLLEAEDLFAARSALDRQFVR